jgi:hypothetical protein
MIRKLAIATQAMVESRKSKVESEEWGVVRLDAFDI